MKFQLGEKVRFKETHQYGYVIYSGESIFEPVYEVVIMESTTIETVNESGLVKVEPKQVNITILEIPDTTVMDWLEHEN